MILSRSTQYALELVLYIVTHDHENFIPLSIIADKLDLSFPFLGKITQPLVKNKIIKSFRGPYGGVTLAKPAAKISHYDVIIAIEGKSYFENCILRPLRCNEGEHCPIHDFDAEIRATLKQSFQNETMDKYFKANDTANDENGNN